MTLPNFCLGLFGLLLTAGPATAWQNDASTNDARSRSPLSATVVVELTDGSSLPARINAVDQTGIELIAESQARRFTFEQLSSLNFNPAPSPDKPTGTDLHAGQVTFIDGTQIKIGDLTIVDRSTAVTSVGGTRIEADVAQLSTLSLFGLEASDQDRNQWDLILQQPRPTSDAIVVSKNGTLQMIEGVVGDISSQQLTFSMETRTAKVAIEKIKGVIFYRANRELADAICQLILIDQSALQVRSMVRSTTGNGFDVITVGGVEVFVDVAQMSRIDFSVGRFVYLSDLVPATNDWTPLLASPEIVNQLKSLRVARFNEDFRGQPIALESIPQQGAEYLGQIQSFNKGVAISGGGRVTYSLNGQFKRLTGKIGFDPQTYPQAVVRFVIKTDGQTAISEVLNAKDLLTPIPLDLDVSKTDRILIAVEYEDGRIAGDILHLADLKVSR